MALKATKDSDIYIQARGLRQTCPKALNEALRLALETMPVMLYGKTREELTPPSRPFSGGVDWRSKSSQNRTPWRKRQRNLPPSSSAAA